MIVRTSALIARVPALAAILSAAFVVSSCSSGSSPPAAPPPPPVTVSSVAVSAPAGNFVTATEVAKGAVVQFKAQTSLSNSTSNDVTATATWASSDDTVLAFQTASLPGLGTAKKQGPVTITATESGGVAGTLTYTVAAPAPTSLAIDPPQVPNSVPVGLEGNFKATYIMTDKSTADATNDVDWASSLGDVVVIGNQAGNKGKAIALKAGKSNISASKGTLTSQNVEINVFAPAVPPQFVVEPASPDQLPLGRRQQFKASLKYQNGTVTDVTNKVTWMATPATSGQFPNDPDIPTGTLVASPTTPGVVTVIAQDPASSAQTAPVMITVASLAIDSVEITPVGTASTPLAAGAKRQLGVLAKYADDKSRNISKTVDWAVGGLGHLDVTNSSSNKGLVSALRETPPGTNNDTVEITDPISMGSVSIAIQTLPRNLEKIEIAPVGTVDLPQGHTLNFTATAIFTDTTKETVTDQVTWETSKKESVTISNIAMEKGKATAVGTAGGSTTVWCPTTPLPRLWISA